MGDAMNTGKSAVGNAIQRSLNLKAGFTETFSWSTEAQALIDAYGELVGAYDKLELQVGNAEREDFASLTRDINALAKTQISNAGDARATATKKISALANSAERLQRKLEGAAAKKLRDRSAAGSGASDRSGPSAEDQQERVRRAEALAEAARRRQAEEEAEEKSQKAELRKQAQLSQGPAQQTPLAARPSDAWPRQNLDRERIQVRYNLVLDIAQGPTIARFEAGARRVIPEVTDVSNWSFDFALAGENTVRIERIGYPRVFNGHGGEHGHAWQWQLDAAEMGKGTTDRLYIDDVEAVIAGNDVVDAGAQVGTERFKLIEVTITLTGNFSAEKKHK